MKRPEILAPVGGQEQLIAAVRAGADAVYLGAKGFNARQNAENFTSLREAVAYCHARGVLVYVTLNTLVMDEELESLLDTIEEIAESGADAVIVQDLGVARLLRDCCGELPRHASTQMAIHNKAGTLEAERLGFSRVVAAREMSLPELESLCKTGVEIEAFVHGAHCMSASGSCYLSAMLGGRSGNRGRCAQPCRLDFRAKKRNFALSLKDMSYVENLEKMAEAGVCSLKIEGRMKRPEYVAAAVNACRQALAGRKPDLESLRAVFSRSGFTDGYLRGRRDLSMFGNRTKEDVCAASGVLGELSALYRAERQSIPVSMELRLQKNEAVKLSLEASFGRVELEGPVPETALKRALDEEAARRSLEKTGGTPFYLKELRFSSQADLTLPASALNALRRDGLERLLHLAGSTKPWAMERKLPVQAERKPGEMHVFGRFESFEQAKNSSCSLLILPLEALETLKEEELFLLGTERLAAELPALLYPGSEEKIPERLKALLGKGIRYAVAENIGALRIIREAGLIPIGGAGLNILNSISLEEYEKLGLKAATASFELQMKKIGAMKGTCPLGIVAYGYLPLMRFRACPMQGEKGCMDCDGKQKLVDRKGVEFTVLCHKKQYSSLLNSLPLYLADKALPPLDFVTLYFTVETPEECRRIEEAYQTKKAPEGNFTRGLYYRELQ